MQAGGSRNTACTLSSLLSLLPRRHASPCELAAAFSQLYQQHFHAFMALFAFSPHWNPRRPSPTLSSLHMNLGLEDRDQSGGRHLPATPPSSLSEQREENAHPAASLLYISSSRIRGRDIKEFTWIGWWEENGEKKKLGGLGDFPPHTSPKLLPACPAWAVVWAEPRLSMSPIQACVFFLPNTILH